MIYLVIGRMISQTLLRRHLRGALPVAKNSDRQYKIVMDSSRRVTVRNRRHLRKVEKNPVLAGGRG